MHTCWYALSFFFKIIFRTFLLTLSALQIRWGQGRFPMHNQKPGLYLYSLLTSFIKKPTFLKDRFSATSSFLLRSGLILSFQCVWLVQDNISRVTGEVKELYSQSLLIFPFNCVIFASELNAPLMLQISDPYIKKS